MTKQLEVIKTEKNFGEELEYMHDKYGNHKKISATPDSVTENLNNLRKLLLKGVLTHYSPVYIARCNVAT